MGRLKQDFLDRIDQFVDRMLDVVNAVEPKCRSPRIIDQMSGCCTSVGANTAEADEAMSRKDFCKTLGISLKELNETLFWLRLVARRKWVPAPRLALLIREAVELKRIIGAIISNTRGNDSG